MSLKIVFPVLLLALFSCNQVLTSVPEPDVPKDTFALIMAEIQIADAYHSHMVMNQQSIQFNQGLLYINILKKHNFTREQYQKTMEYYSRNLEEFDDLLNTVVSILEEKEVKINEKHGN